MPDTNNPNEIAAPDLGGSFEENGQVRRQQRVGAVPGERLVPSESTPPAEKTGDDSSAGS